MENEIHLDRSSIAWQAFEEFSGQDEIPVDQKRSCEKSLGLPIAPTKPEDQIVIHKAIVPEY